MTNDDSQFFNRADLVYHFAPQLYRVALLIAGSPREAAQLVERAYAALPDDAPGTEAALIQRLLPSRRQLTLRTWRAHVGREQIERAGLDQQRADDLLHLLGRRTPAERLIVGLHYGRGYNPTEIATLLGAVVPDPAAVLSQLRRDVVAARGDVPADVATLAQLDQWLDGALDEDATVAVRQRVFEDASVRVLRDALMAVREMLPRAISAFFAAPAPHNLIERLVAHAAPSPTPRRPRLARVQVLLTVGVLMLVTAIIFGPGLLARPAVTGQTRLTPAEIVDAAIHRFDRSPLQAGVLHERYRVETDGSAHVLERWYDYAVPHRVAFSLHQADSNGPPQVAISSDGRSVIQYRYAEAMHADPPALDVRVTLREAQTALPLLRNFSATRLFLAQRDAADIAPLYLGEARARGVRSLGQTTMLGRPAYLLAYDQPISETVNGQAERVLLTIDAATYALLDVSVITAGAAESTARHPLRAEVFVVQDTVPETVFTQTSDNRTVTREGLTSVYLPTLVDNRLLTLTDAARQSRDALLVPQQLPDERMRGFALDGRRDNDVVLIYEGEFQSTLLLPQGQWGGDVDNVGEERNAGDYRYRLVRGFGDPNFASSAQVYRPDAPNERLLAVLLDAYATPAERQAKLEQVIASLTPVTPQNLPTLEAQFYPPAGG